MIKEKILEWLMHHDGNCVSGQNISEKLGISRTAVWKHIKSLQEQGYPIQSIDRKGYLLASGQSFLLAGEVKKQLKTKVIGGNVTVLPSVTSTNLHAKEMQDQLSHGDVILSEEQTKGKGRMGKPWSSPRGDGLWVTVFLKPSFAMEKAAFITQLAAAAMWQAVYKHTDIRAEIKWPNDLLINGKKICGILTELSGEINQIEYMLVGIGLNVNTVDFPDDLKETATSLYLETETPRDRTKLLVDFLQSFEAFYTDMEKEDASQQALQIIRQHSSVLGKSIRVIRGSHQVNATGIQILENGNLEIEQENGRREILTGGEISVRNLE